MQATSIARAEMTKPEEIRHIIRLLKPNRPEYEELAEAIMALKGQLFSPAELAIKMRELITDIEQRLPGYDLSGLSGDIMEMEMLLWKGVVVTVEDPDLSFGEQLSFALLEQFVL